MKRIVVCLDGTWNSDDTQTTDTNVSQIARAIHGSQEIGGILQIVLYLRGVGTTGLTGRKDRLALDWACLPDHQTLAPTAPSHDSSSGFFALDGYRPTYRVIGGKAFSTAFNEVLYTAVDENNHPVQTINERVHRSVVNRYGKPAQACSDDDKGVCAIAPYSPKNLAPLFPQNVFAGLPIED
jgi:Uncharacterized alpha/beta hydrolase domain (DUF2235)